MPAEPGFKRAVAFFDGQNLFHAARAVFGSTYPDYDPTAIAGAVCRIKGWGLVQARFYTSVPSERVDPFWQAFWTAKLEAMRRRGVHVSWRELHYHTEWVTLPDGGTVHVRCGREKGIDVRIALDMVRLALSDGYDVALLFSQDQDLAEAAAEVREISSAQQRWIKVASAYPWSASFQHTRGVNGTEWVRMEEETYAACVDHRDYRPHPQ